MRIGIEGSLLFRQRSGIGRYLENLIGGLGSIDNYNAYVVFAGSFRQREKLLPQASAPNIAVRQLRLPIETFQVLSGMGKWPLPFFERFSGTADILHWPNYLLIDTGRSRSVVNIHDLSILLYPGWHPWTRVKRFQSGLSYSAQKADAIIVPSCSTKSDVLKLLCVKDTKVHVVSYSTSPSFMPAGFDEQERLLRKYGLVPGRYIAFLGNLEPRKNLRRLLEAFSALVRQGLYDYPLVLIGAEGWKMGNIARDVSRLSLDNHVRFTGYVSEAELPIFLSGAMLLVYPSVYEGFGLPPLEAMACGTPVITSNTSSLPEVAGDAAVLVDPYDTYALESAMLRVLSSADLRESLKQRGLLRAKMFSREQMARETLNVYETVYNAS